MPSSARPTDRQIAAFIDRLASCETPPDACNEYAYGGTDNAIRRENLRLYLSLMAERLPNALLVMEAPGYRGCRLTGVPATSRKLLLESVPQLDLFGAEAGFGDARDAGFDGIYGEQTATIVWRALAQRPRLPLLWNAYPFHPHRPGNPRSNRKPRKGERETGEGFLRCLLRLWDFERVIAVGNVAHETLLGMGVECHKTRHPAQGGKRDFVAGLNALLLD